MVIPKKKSSRVNVSSSRYRKASGRKGNPYYGDGERSNQNKTPLIIGAVVGGAILLVVLLAMISGPKVTPPGTGEPAGVDQQGMYNEGKDLFVNSRKHYYLYMQNQDINDARIAYRDATKCIEIWNKLSDILNDESYTEFAHELQQAIQLLNDIIKSSPVDLVK